MRGWIVWFIMIIMLLPPGAILIGENVKASGSSSFVWEDDFLDEGKIDKSHSWNYTVDKEKGIVIMKNTCRAWWNASWRRMVEIFINNSGSVDYKQYVLDFTVYYDTDMQPDFDDLRFTDEDGNLLQYWVDEKVPGESAHVYVRVPHIPPHNTTTIYMFYGDENAHDAGEFDVIFVWEDRTDPDIMISYKAYSEGAWDPDVAFGSNKFLVAWEEGIGPEDLPYDGDRLRARQIHGRLYDKNGQNPYPDPASDTDIYISSDPDDGSYHAENPSIAYGDGVFFVAWEENKIADGRWAVDIKGALVTPDGNIIKRFTICSADKGQYDPCVAFGNHRFFVVWEDSRHGYDNYDVYGRIYDANGNPLTSDFPIDDGASYQGQPWICADDQGYFMVVYESGIDPETGPFSIYARKFDSNGNPATDPFAIAVGSEHTDYIFPAVAFCSETGEYLVVWNDGDVSVDPNSRSSYDGNIWGKILDRYGNTIHDNFIIQPGNCYIRADVKNYLGTMFFVTYDDGSNIWGRLISAHGDHITKEHMISDGSSSGADWNNIAVGAGNIFCVWEDERDQASQYPDVFGSVWHVHKATGSPDIACMLGEEKEEILLVVVTSKEISPDGLIAWREFHALFDLPLGVITFNILDENCNIIPGFENISSGKDLSTIDPDEYPAIRLQAVFTRHSPSDSPILDRWNVSWIGIDTAAPTTSIYITGDEGNEGWYRSNIKITLEAFDDGSGVDCIYYVIDGGNKEVYRHPITISEEGFHTFSYWAVDYAGNEEEHHTIEFGIDKHRPDVSITRPRRGYVYILDSKMWKSLLGWTLILGGVTIEASASDSLSGIDRVEFYLDDTLQQRVSGEQSVYRWKCRSSMLFIHLISARAFDKAGNSEDDAVYMFAVIL